MAVTTFPNRACLPTHPSSPSLLPPLSGFLHRFQLSNIRLIHCQCVSSPPLGIKHLEALGGQLLGHSHLQMPGMGEHILLIEG